MGHIHLPILSIIGAAVFLSIAAVLLIVVDPEQQSTPAFVAIIGLIASTIPGLIAAVYSERASRDIRNGTVTDKAAEGAQKALDNTGITEVVANSQQTSNAALQALTRILENQGESNGRPPI